MITPADIDSAVRTLVQAAKPAHEMVRLRRVLRPLRIPVELLGYSLDDVDRWGEQTG